jgi:hypothetical protein
MRLFNGNIRSPPNYCARNLGDLRIRVSRNLRSMQRPPTLLRAFWQQAALF